ncbi:MAG: hypothetical protein PHH08_05155 [Candidatus ainarchaeum sp.]|nr:hypothetical protein [Candidatus ainarchaeum sp.]
MPETVPRRMKRFYRRGKEGSAADESGLNPERPGQKGAKDIRELIAEDITAQEKKSRHMEIAVTKVNEFRAKHKRLPTPDEYDQIAENIYSQLKDQEASGRLSSSRRADIKRIPGIQQPAEKPAVEQAQPQRRGRTKAERAALRGPSEGGFSQAPAQQEKQKENLKGLEIKDFLKEDSDELKEFKEGGEEEPLEEDSGEEGNFDLSGLGKEESPDEEKCPNCKRTAEEVLFCPECGAGFCEQCAKTERIGSEKKIVCPKCGKTIKK